MAVKMVHEVLQEVAAARGKKKIEVLKKNESRELRDVLQMAFDDGVTIILPPGTPPYTPMAEGLGSGVGKATRKFAYFCKSGPGQNMLPPKREMMFIGILETVNEKEAEMLVAAKDGGLDKMYKGLTKKLVAEAFPDLLIK